MGARAVGMQREGVRRRFYFQNGRWEDQVIFAIDRARVGLAALRPQP